MELASVWHMAEKKPERLIYVSTAHAMRLNAQPIEPEKVCAYGMKGFPA